MNTHLRYGSFLYYAILLWGSSVLAGSLSSCTTPIASIEAPTVVTPTSVESAGLTATATVTVEPATPLPTPSPTLTPTPAIPVILEAKIRRSGPRPNEYFIDGQGMEAFHKGDLLVVYANDPAGFEFDAAVMYVVDINPDNLIAKAIFQIADVALDSLEALRVDKDFENVNLSRMRSIDSAFVGFTVAEGQIRINPNEPLRAADELLAVQFTANGDTIAASPVLMFRVNAVSTSGEMANVSIIDGTRWPNAGTLLVPRNASQTFSLMVNDFFSSNEICVRQGDEVRVSAEGTVVVGEIVGALGPEGKDHFLLGGVFPTPIDPIYDIVPEFPHGVLMFRIADPTLSATEGWMHYAATKQFVTGKAGCLEFDINDKDKSNNNGAFSVQIAVNP